MKETLKQSQRFEEGKFFRDQPEETNDRLQNHCLKTQVPLVSDTLLG
jgi:hypothetical protein